MPFIIIPLITCLLVSLASPADSGVFNVASGDVAGLIAAMNAANANGEENTINLEAGTYTLTAPDNTEVGRSGLEGNGLPVVTGVLIIRGAGTAATIIKRSTDAPNFRVLRVALAGSLVLEGITVAGGALASADGGGIANEGTVVINNSTITRNSAIGSLFGAGFGAEASAGGIFNRGNMTITKSTVTDNLTGGRGSSKGGISNSGTMTIVESTISNNVASGLGFATTGGIGNNGTMTIVDSTISGNTAVDALAGGINNGGTLVVTNSTITRNTAGVAAGIGNFGILTLTNSTVAENHATGSGRAGIDTGSPNIVNLQNTILALNTAGTEKAPSDCSGIVTSLGNNLIGDLTGCTVQLQPTDLTGDPGLGVFVDDGAPGRGRVPLLAGSRAIDAANDIACSESDQLGTPRRDACDIGAVEFYPLINNLVAVGNLSTTFDPTPVAGGPAGAFRITAEFTNTSTQPIGHRFTEVVDLSGDNLLLNADGGTGGVGARLTPAGDSTLPPGATQTFEFVIGLQQKEAFTFLVNMLGDPQITGVAAVEKKNKRQRVKKVAAALKRKLSPSKRRVRNAKVTEGDS